MYRHHAFISYAWADDQSFAAAGGPDQQGANRGWVSTFHDHYRNHLGREIGRIPEGERIWLDYEQLHGNDAITPEILDALKHSALLIPILSNAWFASPWCRQEFTTFTEHYPDWRERLFPVWMAPVEPDDLDEEARAIRERLRKLLGYQFWYRDQAKEIYTHWFPDPDPTDRDYHNIQQKMARHMTEQLRQLKQLGQLTEDVSNPTPTRPLRGRSPTPYGPPVPPIEGSYFVMITGGSSDLSLVQDISRVLGTREGLCYLVPLMAQSQRDRYKPSELRRDLRENLKLATTVLMVFRTGPAGEVHEQLHEYEQVFTKRRDRTPGLDVWHLGDQPLGFHLPGMRVHRVTDGDIVDCAQIPKPWLKGFEGSREEIQRIIQGIIPSVSAGPDSITTLRRMRDERTRQLSEYIS